MSPAFRILLVLVAGAFPALCLAEDSPQQHATRDVWSGAVGFRYQLARLFGMHAGLDVGVSDGETAIYLQVGNAWFRP